MEAREEPRIVLWQRFLNQGTSQGVRFSMLGRGVILHTSRRSLLETKRAVRASCRWIVGNGQFIRVWYDPWLLDKAYPHL